MAQRNNKYDRQLRIWGDHGQAALEHASVCLLNCGPTGSEALKNLVLGGIGSFTIVDPSRVEAADLGNNFLVSWENLGQSKARSVCALLQELNESVGAKFVEESPEALLDSNPSFFASFTLVIATQMPEKALIKLDETCRQQRVMLLVARSYGLAGLVRICIQEHDVIESKPDNPVDDLRLHKPWPELKRFVDQFDIDAKDQLEHQHIPFAIILVKVAEEWKAAHGGRLPSGSKERAEFKAAVRARKQSDDEDNYKEALASAYKVWAPPTISSELHSVLDDSAVEIHSTSTDFWILMFMANDADGDLPLDGAIPDMHSYTDYYIRLQKVYQDRAEANVSAVEANVKSILRKIARDSLSISRSTIKQFCKNARNLRVLRYRTLADEFSPLAAFKIQRLLAVEESSNVEIYILLRAVDQFAATYNRYPGIFDRELEQDVLRLKAICINLLNDIGVNGASISEDLISEFCRFGAAEIHCVASVIGGIASQEAIKILTRQFTPLSGTFIYNAIESTSSVLQL
ncbi:hypothetical protein O6H91_18G033900 [Diphasiastrum complanatum]|uniref:Uncharacterized protein n=1 Tax=Diphasiastrum complanatum TaxID=34168 RepID=A0ACC2AZT4_DIPCM|nr:hypothetical protein O6H91_18G033900 [Diphasiastrum complanatum]